MDLSELLAMERRRPMKKLMHKKSIYYCKYMSPLGPMVMAGEGEALTGLWFEGQKYFNETCLGEGRKK